MFGTSCRRFHTSRFRTIALSAFLFLLAISFTEPGLASETGISPLAPPDTSSPGATLKSFRESTDAAYRAFYNSHDIPFPRGTSAQTRGLRTLDTSQLPPIETTRLATEAVILLNEALDHVALPAYDEISDVKALRSTAGKGPLVYRIPGTDIAIVEIETGPKKGEFLFSAETVDRAREFYENSLSMTPRPGTMKGLYRLVSIAPGHMISRAWTEHLPNWAKEQVLDEAVWKWFASVPIIAFWGLALVLAYRHSRAGKGDQLYWMRFFLALGAIGLTFFVLYLLKSQIILLGPVFRIVYESMSAAILIITAVALINLGKAIAGTIISARQIDQKKIEAHLISISCDVVAWVLAIILLSVGANRLGIPIEAVFASLGVGGLAVALASRPTLENLIAGVTLYLDKPVRVGDFCKFDDAVGCIEQIGLRSTRVRLLSGSLVSMPNAHFADLRLENLNDRKHIMFRGRFGLRLETSPDQLRFVLAKLLEMLIAHPKAIKPRARLIGFDEHSMRVELRANVDTVNMREYQAVREDIYMRTLEIIEQAGTGLAVPIKLVHQTKDSSIDLDDKLTAAAEKQVKSWRESGELPFPNISKRHSKELQDTLDYPPKGSIDYEPLETPDAKREKT